MLLKLPLSMYDYVSDAGVLFTLLPVVITVCPKGSFLLLKRLFRPRVLLHFSHIVPENKGEICDFLLVFHERIFGYSDNHFGLLQRLA